MIFSSFEFVGFAILVIIILACLQGFSSKPKPANICLLAASYYFYGFFNIGFLAILIFITAVNYSAPLLWEKCQSHRKAIFISAIAISLLPLLTYKYSIFIICSVIGFESFATTTFAAGLLLPVGISFFTFQALTYTIDAYRDKIHARRSLIDVALFISFFPTILSGPIERARNLIPQIEHSKTIDSRCILDGCAIFLWGVFKKIVIADRLGTYVDMAYGSAQYQSSSTLALAAALYSIQIYCDFSGYSDMAMGVAKCLGFELSRNFNFPYFSTSIKSFWRKWHISLTSWFTEYVYFPLGGSRVDKKARWVCNISTVFLLSGIWHGAAWTFLAWGALHALLYLVEHFAGLQKKEYRNWLAKVLSGMLVFLLVSFAWIFFRADDWAHASLIVTRIFSFDSLHVNQGLSDFTFAINFALLLVFLIFEYYLFKKRSFIDTSVSQHSLSQGSLSTMSENPQGANGSLLNVTLTRYLVALKNIAWFATVTILLALFGSSSDKFVYFQF